MIGVLLMSFGTPDSPDDVPEFYTRIRGGQPPSEAVIADLQRRYRLIGGRSPLTDICRELAAALEARLQQRGVEARVYLGMKNWHPLILDAVPRMVADGVRHLIAVPLAPHYTTVSTGAYRTKLDEALAAVRAPLDVSFVLRWGDNPHFLDGVAECVRQALLSFPDPARVRVVFTAHSIPERYVSTGERYPEEVRASAIAVAERVGLIRWDLAYQSAGAYGGPWLGPDILEYLRDCARSGDREVLVVPIGFIADHLEILHDIDIQAQELARQLDITLRRPQMLNASPPLVEALVDVVLAQTEVMGRADA